MSLSSVRVVLDSHEEFYFELGGPVDVEKLDTYTKGEFFVVREFFDDDSYLVTRFPLNKIKNVNEKH